VDFGLRKRKIFVEEFAGQFVVEIREEYSVKIGKTVTEFLVQF
jgi:hypothetical protein